MCFCLLIHSMHVHYKIQLTLLINYKLYLLHVMWTACTGFFCCSILFIIKKNSRFFNFKLSQFILLHILNYVKCHWLFDEILSLLYVSIQTSMFFVKKSVYIFFMFLVNSVFATTFFVWLFVLFDNRRYILKLLTKRGFCNHLDFSLFLRMTFLQFYLTMYITILTNYTMCCPKFQ